MKFYLNYLPEVITIGIRDSNQIILPSQCAPLQSAIVRKLQRKTAGDLRLPLDLCRLAEQMLSGCWLPSR